MSKLFKKASLFFIVGIMLSLVLAACGTDNTATPTAAPAATTAPTTGANPTTGTGSGGSFNSAVFTKAKGCQNIGILLPESDSSARWEGYDRPLLTAELKKVLPNATIQYSNANNDADKQQNQAETAITSGACILVVGAKDSDKASAIVQKAKASGIPVIAYDRLIQDNDTAFYVSFDNVKVGELQGQFIVDQYKAGAMGLKKGAKMSMINGSTTDNNAILFNKGAMNKLQPLIDSQDIVKVYDKFTPNWDNATAQQEMEAALTQANNDIQIAYVANDGMANTVIAALRAQKLNGKVLVTGQDAQLSGIQNILTGDQSMTVYKAIPKEAQAAAALVGALSNGTDTGSMATASTDTKAGGKIPSVLAVPAVVTKDNVSSTVIADGFLKKEDICKGLPAGTGGVC